MSAADLFPRRSVLGRPQPEESTFRELTARFARVPVFVELPADTLTPVGALLRLGHSPYEFLLESVDGGERVARYSFLGVGAEAVLTCDEGRGVWTDAVGHRTEVEGDPVSLLRQAVASERVARLPGLPRFFGGAVGYLGYDVIRHYEPVPLKKRGGPGFPEACFLLTRTVLVFDHVRQTLTVVTLPGPDGADGRAAYRAARRELERVQELLTRGPAAGPEEGAGGGLLAAGGGAGTGPAGSPETAEGRGAGLTSTFDREGFCQAVRRLLREIREGEIFQAVPSQRFSLPYRGNPLELYRALRRVNPSPYMFYLRFGRRSLVGASPEVMIRVEEGRAMLRPLAGTRRRGRTPEEDRALAEELLADSKERAEHVMLVDLARNDLGRVCRFGSVRVSRYLEVERYSHVMHLVSEVEGELSPEFDALDALVAAFPAGTVSGAPKIRAMQLIDEVEPEARGPYAGAVGYVGYNGNLDTCIAIRTALLDGETCSVQVGAGVVADSDPEREYEETVNKARAILELVAGPEVLARLERRGSP